MTTSLTNQPAIRIVDADGNPVDAAWGKAGDVVKIAHECVMLFRQCDRVIRGYHCVLCAQHLANRGQLEMHLEERNHPHWIVSHCAKHGYEACEDPRR